MKNSALKTAKKSEEKKTENRWLSFAKENTPNAE